MRLYLTTAILAVFVFTQTTADGGWSWGGKDDKKDAEADIKVEQDAEPAAAIIVERSATVNNTELDEVIDSILASNRQGRNVQGYDEIYSDPSIQEVLQKGDDTDARNLIKDRLCSLGLMQCEEDSGYIAPEDLVYAQPVDIKPIGRPIASIAVKNPARAYYGPAKPVPYPSKNGPPNGPPRRFGPQGNKQYFGPPNGKPFGPPPGYNGQELSRPPPGYNGPELSRPPPGYNGPELSRPPPGYNGPELSRPPPGFNGPPSNYHGSGGSRPPFIEAEIPYEFESSSNSGSFYNKDEIIKKRPIIIPTGSIVDPVQQHVHHHFHHGSEADGSSNKLPTVIVNNPVPISTASLGNSFNSGSSSSSFNSGSSFGSGSSGNSFGSFKPSEQLSGGGFNSGNSAFLSNNNFKTESQFGGLTTGAGVNSQFKPPSQYVSPGLTIGGSGLGGSYGGQSIAHYGSSGASNDGLASFATKPVVENFGPQQFGSSGSSGQALYGNNFNSQSSSSLGYGNGNSNGNGNTYGSAQSSYGGGNSFGASVGSYGNSDFYKKELSLNNGQTNHLTGYGDRFQGVESSRSENYDCVCVPFDQCPSQDVIGRKDDLYLALDPRNLKSDIQAEEERVITDGNGNMTIIRVAKDTGINSTTEATKTEEIKKISKREAPVDKKDDSPKSKIEARQNNDNNKNIKPTFGVSFGLPAQGGYPINPVDHHNPLVNPYGGYGGSNGINLGLVSVNPLVSIQVTKDDYGDKVVKPFVNLHVTPNDFLVHKFSDFFAYKKHALYNKHQHYHQHSYKPHYPHHHQGPHYGPIYEHGPIYDGPNHYNGPHYDGPNHYDGPYREGPDFQGPDFQRPEFIPSHHEPHFDNRPGYVDDSFNFGGGYGGNDGFYGRSFPNASNNNLVNQFNQLIQNGQNAYSSSYNKYLNYNQNQAQLQLNSNHYDSYGNPAKDNAYDISRRGKSLFNVNTANPVKFPNNRRRRDVTDEQEVKSKSNIENRLEKRQAFYGNGNNLNTCGPRHVCCRRPTRPQVPIPGSNNRQCGTRHSQGINGRIKNPVYVDGDSEFGEYPWQVAILKKDPKESVYVCGGTLIDPFHIITAAHCVKTYTPYDLRVRLGEWDVNHDVEFFPYVERDITTLTVHPEFYAGTLYNDIAILRMDKPVDFSKYPHISPACLPSPHEDYTGTRCWTTGWGKDAFGDFGKYQNILKEVDVPIMGQGECQSRLQHTRLGQDFKLHPGFVCAGGEEGKDACKGDGGGPMVCEKGGSMQIVGVVSWGIGCGQTGVPGVYVKVSHYLEWIRQITQRF